MTQSQIGRRQVKRRSGWRFSGSTGATWLLIVTLMGIGGMYLAVSAKAADAGRQVLTLEKQREELAQSNAELVAAWSQLTAPERMLVRASELGFKPAGPDDVDYLTLEGYLPPAPFEAPKPAASGDLGATALSPAYTETLGEWFARVFGSEASE